jgi:hypothetical protein
MATPSIRLHGLPVTRSPEKSSWAVILRDVLTTPAFDGSTSARPGSRDSLLQSDWLASISPLIESPRNGAPGRSRTRDFNLRHSDRGPRRVAGRGAAAGVRDRPDLFGALQIVGPTVRLRWSPLFARQCQRRWLPPARRVALDREAPPGERAVQAVGDDHCAARVDPGSGTSRIAEHVTRLAWRNPLRVMSRTQRRAG